MEGSLMISMLKSKNDMQKTWKEKTIEYASAINLYVKKGQKQGWENAGPEPKDNGRENLVPYLLKAIRAANEDGNLNKLREEWPLAHSPLIPELEKNGQSIPTVAILSNKKIVARIGSHYEKGYVVEIEGDKINVVDGVEFFGQSPNQKFFAYTKKEGVSVTLGWLGKEVAVFPYPDGTEGVPSGYEVKAFELAPVPSKLIPFPDGQKVLFVSPEGIFLLSNSGVSRILPTTEDMQEHFKWSKEEYHEDELRMNLAMEHGAVSSNGDLVAVGSQDSSHLVFDDNGNLVGDIGNQSEYPHFALFSKNAEWIAFNSCHFYNGITVGVPTKLLPGLKTQPYEENKDTPIIEDGARVYAGVYRNNEFIIGDASGYLRAFGTDGKQRWQHFIGSTIGDIAISNDESLLVCSTYAGFISILKLDNGYSEPYEIGNGGHTEFRRWLFWKNEPTPLAW